MSTRHVEELLEELGIQVDHSSINWWSIKCSPKFETSFHHRNGPVQGSWRFEKHMLGIVKLVGIGLDRPMEPTR